MVRDSKRIINNNYICKKIKMYMLSLRSKK